MKPRGNQVYVRRNGPARVLCCAFMFAGWFKRTGACHEATLADPVADDEGGEQQRDQDRSEAKGAPQNPYWTEPVIPRW